MVCVSCTELAGAPATAFLGLSIDSVWVSKWNNLREIEGALGFTIADAQPPKYTANKNDNKRKGLSRTRPN